MASLTDASALGPDARRQALARLRAGGFDVLVVGGGITGAGAALDAAARGLDVGLVEARDWAAGTSSKSSKLIHGGLRYLEMLDFGLVREALRERELLLTRLAPHLVRPVPFLWPLTHRAWERVYLGSGLLLYDRLGGARSVPRARHLSRREALRIAPGLAPGAFVGGIQFHDAQEDDARMVVAVARTAAAAGAALATRVAVTGFVRDGAGRVCGVRAVDHETGETLEVRARHTITAAGVWTDELRRLAGASSTSSVRPSKGVHLTVPRDRLPLETGLLLRTERSVLFVIPWGDLWLIGDTDTDWPYERVHPAATRRDVEYLLAKANGVLADPLTPDDVVGVFAGLRPLVARDASSDTTRLSREHTVETPVSGLTTIAGGKYTTYRVMAQDVVDTALHALGRSGPASVTAELPLAGADGYAARRHQVAALEERAGLSRAQVERLLERHGGGIDDLVALIGARPELAQPLPGAERYLLAEVVHACTHEGALHLADVLARRTRVSWETRHRGVECAPVVAGLMAAELGWDAAATAREVDHWRRRVAAERRAESLPDDAAASAARLEVPELVRFATAPA